MALASAIRGAFSVLNTIHAFQDIFWTTQCPATSDDDSINAFGIIFSIAITLFGNFFPVIIILRIYTLEEKPEEMCKSLIVTEAPNPTSSLLVR